MTELSPELLLLLVPLAIVQIGLVVAALWDLTRPGRRVRGGSRVVWALVILLVGTIGPIVYFVVGREEAASAETTPAAPAPDAVTGWRPPDAATAAPSPPPATLRAAAPTPAAGPEAMAPPRSFDGPAIVCRGLTKRYPGPGGGVLALDGLDLEVPAGSVFGLLGPNGAGKTTTLRILAGLTHRTGGSASVAGTAVVAGETEVPRHIGFLDEDPRYYGWLSGRETVDLAARLHGLDGADRTRRTAEVLARVGMTEAADRRVATYSGGMRQRLGIAQALVNRPPVLVLDEPVSSLDPEGRRDLLGLVAGLRGTTTVLFSTHVLGDVERVCDRIAIIDRGRLVVEGPLDDLLARFALPIYRLDPEPGQGDAIGRLEARLGTLDWVADVTVEHDYVRVIVTDPARAARELLPAVVAEGVALVAFERVRPTLEDVFLRLVGRDGGSRAA
jgi:ABC-2 type transport system ATP-binding protein